MMVIVAVADAKALANANSLNELDTWLKSAHLTNPALYYLIPEGKRQCSKGLMGFVPNMLGYRVCTLRAAGSRTVYMQDCKLGHPW